MPDKIVTFVHIRHIFRFLVAYRWAALFPALWMLVQMGGGALPSQVAPPALVFTAALLVNLGISLFNRPLNRLLLRFPLLLGLDLLFCGAILGLSGSAASPYYLYVLSPLLAGAFFFQLRGALAASAAFTPLYLIAVSRGNPLLPSQPLEMSILLTQLTGIWLVPVLLAYASSVLKATNDVRDELAAAQDELAEQHADLTTAHRQLKVIHDLTVLLQAAPDLLAVQQRVLGTVTTGLGFRQAIVGLVDPANEVLGNWRLYPQNSSFPSPEPLPLSSENGEAVKALLERKSYTTGVANELLISRPALNSWLRTSKWMILPLYLREHAVGVLMVEIDLDEGLSAERQRALSLVANQAALALGTTILCIDRARRLAVEQERNRIASDIHDTVAQSLFGIVFSLDACVSMLPQQADHVRNELIELRALASGAHDEVRRSIFDLWPSVLTWETLQADLASYVNQCCRPHSFTIEFQANGNDFDGLSPGTRRMIYRITQEALGNAARHSGVPMARLCMNVEQDRVSLRISDQGHGFDTATVLAREYSREHFGLRGIQDRVRAMGGEFEVMSAPGAGTSILIDLPRNGNRSHI